MSTDAQSINLYNHFNCSPLNTNRHMVNHHFRRQSTSVRGVFGFLIQKRLKNGNTIRSQVWYVKYMKGVNPFLKKKKKNSVYLPMLHFRASNCYRLYTEHFEGRHQLKCCYPSKVGLLTILQKACCKIRNATQRNAILRNIRNAMYAIYAIYAI